MDTTRIEDLLTQLEVGDPAEAPDVADEVAAVLAAALDGSRSADSQPADDPAAEEDGGAR